MEEDNGRRWMAETAISVFKSIFCEEILSKKPRWMSIEIVHKTFIYNLLLNAA
ncbi:MAG: hypothetical protein QXH32_01965 [Candidatus Caldarchaeum sp.]